MSLSTRSILDAVRSHAMRLGRFERSLGHEPRSAPGHGLTFAVWADQIRPVRSSGLASTSALMLLKIRLYSNAQQEPADEIDPEMVDAVDDLLTAYAGDLDLGVAAVRSIDLLGAEGFPLRAQAGYLENGDREDRVIDIDLPIIVNDVWPQAL